MKKRAFFLAAAVLLLMAHICTTVAFATPSINDLHGEKSEQTVVAPLDDSKLAEVLEESGVYTSQAVASQYSETDEAGNTRETELSALIAASESAMRETGLNGKSIVDGIPTVRELVQVIDPEVEKTDGKTGEYDLNKLDQLTYMMDLKYITTQYRVVTGVHANLHGQSVLLEDGSIEVTLEGGEVIRSGNIDDYVILLVNPQTNEYTFLKMKTYDSETGVYTVDFPFIGPFMVMQIME